MAVRGILLDIEGTTSSVSFVYDVMFPFARQRMKMTDLVIRWPDPEFRAALNQVARDAGHESIDAWLAKHNLTYDNAMRGAYVVQQELFRLMDADAKTTGLKQLQGLLWKEGFESGQLKAHVYDDVPPALAAWNAAGKDVRIYSSGSIQAQKLFFGHTIVGNLLGHFRGHYDTTIGGKKEAASYSRIAAEFGLPASDIVFLSDVVAELDAARDAGMRSVLVVRPGNAVGQKSSGASHPQISSFADLSVD